MKRTMLVALIATTIAVGGTSTTQAIHSTTSLTDTLQSTVSTVREQTSRTSTEDTTEEKRLELEARKQELEQKLADKRAAISQKLMGARAERCEKKQVNINSMLDTRVAAAQKHFDKFKAIQTRLEALVEEKEINVENHTALELIMTELEDKAKTSIAILGTTDFTCDGADAAAPGAIVKDQVTEAKQDLKNYRDSIKDYATAIKSSIEKTTETPTEATKETESTTETTEEVQQ